ncbi:MAG: tRNA N6-adenosine threonylcarbamoyltransferase [Ignavibacteriaceae bacterium]|nr:MAG: tRNA (adenosine(37)-N6)-threonylcarbamoyltransferase complex transferase subunit TsaD [Chlorobiota bacterium]GJQ32643.1 MAG: tRNA N6-adenosine threonylcarbamoyltransferase [Ignavibacteriaceae bacterium]
MTVLGIETSCDETSVAILNSDEVIVNLISSQDFHKLYGGVVPELSSRAHLEQIVPLTREAIRKAGLTPDDIDVVTATAGPGLIGALLVGFTFAKHFAWSIGKPFVPVNHIEGHIFSGFLMPEKPVYPLLVLTVSGGHTLLTLVESETRIRFLGSTIDDAAGEAFDKVAKMTGLGYPGGPKIQNAAAKAIRKDIVFPVANLKQEFHFSFSGLKTSVLRYVQKNFPDGVVPEEELNEIAFGFQDSVVKALSKNMEKAIKTFKPGSLSLNGGVAANSVIRNEVIRLGEKYNIPAVIPAFEYCGDNAAMIALRGKQLFDAGEKFTRDSEPFPAFYSNYLYS